MFDFLASSKVSMFTRAIFMLPDSELIRESACACAKLFVNEENVHMAQIISWKNKTLTDFTLHTPVGVRVDRSAIVFYFFTLYSR